MGIMSCPRTQHNVPHQGLKPGPLDLETNINPEATTSEG